MNRRCKNISGGRIKCKFDKSSPEPVVDRNGEVKKNRYKFACRLCTQLSIYEFDICEKCGQFRNRHKKKKHDEDECPAKARIEKKVEIDAKVDAQIESYYNMPMQQTTVESAEEEDDSSSILSHLSSFTTDNNELPRCRTRAESERSDTHEYSDLVGAEPDRQRRRTESHSIPRLDDDISLENVPAPVNQMLSLAIVDTMVGPMTASAALEPRSVWWQDIVVSLSLKLRLAEEDIREKLMNELEIERHRLIIELPREEKWITKHSHHALLEDKVMEGEDIILSFQCFIPQRTFFRGVKCFPVARVTGTATLHLQGIDAVSEPITFYSQVTDQDCERAEQVIISLAKSIRNKHLESSHGNASQGTASRHSSIQSSSSNPSHNSSTTHSQLRAADRALVVMARRLVSASGKSLAGLEELAVECGFHYLLHELISKRLSPVVDTVLLKYLGVDTCDHVLAFLGFDSQQPRLWAARRLQVQARRYLSKRTKSKKLPESTRLMVLVGDASYFSSLRFTQQLNFDLHYDFSHSSLLPLTHHTPYLIIWSSATKETIAMERQERRLCQLLQAKRKVFELVFLDLTPNRKRYLGAMCEHDLTLPALSLGYSKYYGSFDSVLEQVDRGSFDALTESAHNAIDSAHCGFTCIPTTTNKMQTFPTKPNIPSPILASPAPHIVAF